MHGHDERVARLLGPRATSWRRRSAPWQPAEAVVGGNERFTVHLDDGRRVFVKAAKAPHTARWLRREAEVYAHLHGSFIAELIAFEDDPVEPLLVLEDLSEADWNVRWDAARVATVCDALASIAASAPPPNTPSVREILGDFGRWEVVEADPGPFLSTGIRSREWLDRALPILKAAADSAAVDGDDLLHLDIRSDNLCFRDRTAVLVDWNWCSTGRADFDIAAWLPSLAFEGGPKPWEVLPRAGDMRFSWQASGPRSSDCRHRGRRRRSATSSGASWRSHSRGPSGNSLSPRGGCRVHLVVSSRPGRLGRAAGAQPSPVAPQPRAKANCRERPLAGGS